MEIIYWIGKFQQKRLQKCSLALLQSLLYFLEAQVSFVEEFLDEVWQDEAALLDRSVVVLHRLRNRASYAGTERIMHLDASMKECMQAG